MALVYWTVYMSWRYNDATGLFEIGWEVLRTVPETGEASSRYTFFEYPYEFVQIDIAETTLISLSEDDIAKEYLFFFIFADGVRDGPYSWQIRFSQMLDGQFLHNIVHTQFHTVGYPPPPPPAQPPPYIAPPTPVQPPPPVEPPPITLEPPPLNPPPPPILPDQPPRKPPIGRLYPSGDFAVWNAFVRKWGDRVGRWALEVPISHGLELAGDLEDWQRKMIQSITTHKVDFIIEWGRIFYIGEIKPRGSISALGSALIQWQMANKMYRFDKLTRPAVICATISPILLPFASQNGITVFVVEGLDTAFGARIIEV